MSPTKRWAIDTILPELTLPRPLTVDALAQGFGRRAPLLLDLGVGTGEATRAWAASHPDHDVVAVELHRPGIAQLCTALDALGPPNVRVLEADAVAVLAELSGRPSPHPNGPPERGERSADGCEAGDAGAPQPPAATQAEPAPVRFAAIRVLFPDPWPKARHRRRRLVDPWFVAAAADVLVPGGCLHLATDWDDYADHMREVLAGEPRLVPELRPPGSTGNSPPIPASAPSPPAPGRAWRSDRPARPVTTYERRGLDAGRTVTDLVVRRTGR
jgi:tRNA (guanine-N7-)-methyltransferase